MSIANLHKFIHGTCQSPGTTPSAASWLLDPDCYRRISNLYWLSKPLHILQHSAYHIHRHRGSLFLDPNQEQFEVLRILPTSWASFSNLSTKRWSQETTAYLLWGAAMHQSYAFFLAIDVLTWPHLIGSEQYKQGCFIRLLSFAKYGWPAWYSSQGHWDRQPPYCTMSNITLVDENLTLFHQYLRYRHKCVTIVFSIPGAIWWA